MDGIEVKHRHTGAVLHSGEHETLKDAVAAATKGGADLRGANLSEAYLRGADLCGASLSEAYLRGANLSEADLRGADLSEAYLCGADLRGAYLCGADLRGAYLCGADLRGADLSEAYLCGADLRGADLRGAVIDSGGRRLIGERPMLKIGRIGSRSDYLIAWITDGGLRIQVGCFRGSIVDFESAVIETHADNEHGREYIAAIAMIRAHAKIWTPADAEHKEADQKGVTRS